MRPKHIICFLAALGSLTATVGCRGEFDDDITALGHRVEYLEDSLFYKLKADNINTQIENMRLILTEFEANRALESVVQNPDGSVKIIFLNGIECTVYPGRNGADGTDGVDGEDGTAAVMGVWVNPEDGHWYWTVNGEPLRDAMGNLMRIDAYDGEDGTDGRDGHDGHDGHDGIDGIDGIDGKDGKDGKDADASSVYVPVVRINPETHEWEISTDGGLTWKGMGTSADGKDGEKGEDGKDGTPDIFKNIFINEGEQTVTFILANGQVITIEYLN